MGRSAQPAPPAAIRRGDVWTVDLDPTISAEIRKTRPAIIVGADALNRARRTVLVVPLSNGPSPHPPVVVSTPSLGATSVAVCDQLRAVDKSRLVARLGRLPVAELQILDAGLRAVLQI